MARLLLLLLLAACASAPPPISTPEQVRTPSDRVADSAAGSAVPHWWTTFNSPALDSLIAEATGASPGLEAAAARVQAAAPRATIAGAPALPQVGLAATGARQKQVFTAFPSPSGGPTISKATSYGVSLELSWELDLWGRLSAGTAAAIADRQSAQAAYAGARLSLAGQTAKAWFAVTEAAGQVGLARATVESYERALAHVEARYRRGLVGSLDLRLTSVELAGARDRLQQREILLDGSRRQLEVLLGRYPGGTIAPGVSLPALVPGVPEGLPANLVSRRPDLVAAERQLAASAMRVRAARRAGYPAISLTGSYGRSSNELADLLDGNFTVWGLVGRLVQPLFQGGRIRAGVRLAEAGGDESLAIYVNAVLTAYGEVEHALAADAFLAERSRQLETAAHHAIAAREIAEQRYRGGLIDLVTMLSAQRSAWQAKSQLLDLQRRRLDARVDLHLALGGDFTGRDAILAATPEPDDEPLSGETIR